MNQDVYYSSKKEDKKWSALDSKSCHPTDDANVAQEASQVDKILQYL